MADDTLAHAPGEELPQGVEHHHQVEGITAARWWSIDELATAEEITPRGLAELLVRLAADGPPAQPLQLR